MFTFCDVVHETTKKQQQQQQRKLSRVRSTDWQSWIVIAYFLFIPVLCDSKLC